MTSWANIRINAICSQSPRSVFPAFVRQWDLTKKTKQYIDTQIRLTKEDPLNILHSTSTGIAFASGSNLGLIYNQNAQLLLPFIASTKQPSPSSNESGTMFNFYFQTKPGERYGDPFVFNLQDRALVPWSKTINLVEQSQENPPGMDLDWYSDTLNGVKLQLKGRKETWAFSAEGDSCLIATEGCQLIRYDKSANIRWSIFTPDLVTGLTVTKDSRLVIASLGDGSIRWYNHGTGEELLAYFPLNDRKNWVLWTPSGYYDASPKGDELIGWYFKESKEKSGEFYPASRFKSLYYRPDIINKVLETLSESKAIVAANEEAGRKQGSAPAVATIVPPTVTIYISI